MRPAGRQAGVVSYITTMSSAQLAANMQRCRISTCRSVAGLSVLYCCTASEQTNKKQLQLTMFCHFPKQAHTHTTAPGATPYKHQTSHSTQETRQEPAQLTPCVPNPQAPAQHITQRTTPGEHQIP
jgi:hypothetical protein